MRMLCLTLCLSLLTYAVAPEVLAQDAPRTAAPMSEQEDRELAARAAQNPELESFKGGDALGVMVSILVIVALCAIIYYFFVVHGHYRSYPPTPYPLPPKA